MIEKKVGKKFANIKQPRQKSLDMTKKRSQRFYVKGKGSFATKERDYKDDQVLHTQNDEQTFDTSGHYKMSKEQAHLIKFQNRMIISLKTEKMKMKQQMQVRYEKIRQY